MKRNDQLLRPIKIVKENITFTGNVDPNLPINDIHFSTPAYDTLSFINNTTIGTIDNPTLLGQDTNPES